MKNLTSQDIFKICSQYCLEQAQHKKDRGLYWELEALEQAKHITQDIVFEKAVLEFYDPKKWEVTRMGNSFEGDPPFIEACLLGKKEHVRVEYIMGEDVAYVCYIDNNDAVSLSELCDYPSLKVISKDTVSLFVGFTQEIAKSGMHNYDFLCETFEWATSSRKTQEQSLARQSYPEIFALLDHKNLSSELADQTDKKAKRVKGM